MPWITAEPVKRFSSYQPSADIEPTSHCGFHRPPPPPPDDHQTVCIYCFSCGQPKKIVLNCGNRLCSYCRSRVVYRNLRRKGIFDKPPKGLRFLTLTVKSVPVLDRESIEKVRNYFRKLIRRKGWKRHVHGGLYVLEATKTRQGYHIHLHVLFDGAYFPYSHIRRLWYDVTGGSYIIWINAVTNARGALSYVLDYVAKVEKSNIPEEEYLAAFKGIKLMQFFGVWAKLKIPKSPCKCSKCGGEKWYSDFDIWKLDAQPWDTVVGDCIPVPAGPGPPEAQEVDSQSLLYWEA